MNPLDALLAELAPITYINKPITEQWVEDGAKMYENIRVEFQNKLAIVIPSDMSIDFLLGAAHIAESSKVGARVCWIVKSRLQTTEFVEKLNAMVARINQGGL